MLSGKECPLLQHIGEGLVEVVSLLLFATEKRDALAVFPDMRQRVTKLGFSLILASETWTK